MPSLVKPPTVETVLLISGAVGGFWCIFVCICQIIRKATKTAKRNTAIYRGGLAQRAAPHRAGSNQNTDSSALHHGVAPVQESLPMRSIFMPSRDTTRTSSATRSHRDSNARRNTQRGASVESREHDSSRRVTSPAGTVIFPDYVERVILPEYVDRGSYLRGAEQEFGRGIQMNEEPPPYDSVHETVDYAPPAYSDIFPNKT